MKSKLITILLILSFSLSMCLSGCSKGEALDPEPTPTPSVEVTPMITPAVTPEPIPSEVVEPTPSATVTPSIEPSPIPSATPAQEQKPNSNSGTTSSGGATTEKPPSPPPAPAPELPASSDETGPGMDFGDALDKWAEEQAKNDTRTQEEKDQFNINASQPISDSSSDGLTSSAEDETFGGSVDDLTKGMQEHGGPGAPGGDNFGKGFDPLE